MVTATRTAQPKATVSSNVTVIQRQQIERSGALTLGELLQGRGDLDIRSYGPVGAVTLPSIRGSTGEQVLVLVDGRPVNPPQGGGVDLADIGLQDVERVEVLHGAASALFGSAAVGGVINVITRGPTPRPSTSLEQQLGSFGSRSLWLTRSDALRSLGYSFSVRHVAAENDFPYIHPSGERRTRANAGFEQTGIRARLVPTVGWPGKLFVDLDWSASRKGVPGLVFSATPHAKQKDSSAALSLSYELPQSAPSTGSFRVYAQQQRRWFSDPDAFPAPQNSLQWVHTLGAELSGRHRHGNGALAYGLDARRDALDSTVVGNRALSVLGVYAQEQLRLGSTTLIPAARWDSTAGLGSQLSPHIGILHHLGPTISLRANAGRAFRTPSLNDLYWPADSFAVGNPHLRPERATDIDAGLTWGGEGAYAVSLTAFRNAVDGLIVWEPGVLVPGKWSPRNIGRAITQGIEAEASFRGDGWYCQGALTLLNARDRSAGAPSYGKRLVGRPTYVASVTAGHQWALWRAELVLHRTGTRYESGDNAVLLPPFTTVDLHLERDIGQVTMMLHISNLTDRRYETVPGYPVPGRSVALSLRERL